MATDAATLPHVEATKHDRGTAVVGSAERRILGQFAIFVGAGYIAYSFITAPFYADAFRVSAAWWSIPALVGVFATGMAIGVAGLLGSLRGIRITTTVAVLYFLLAICLWPLSWNGGLINDSHGLWFVQFNGLPALASALVWRARRSLLYLAAVVVVAAFDNFLVRTDAVASPLITEIAFAGGFCLVPVAAALVGTRTARLLDETRDQAFELARKAAAAQAVATERTRFNALTHDGVMATLLAASRQGNSPAVTQQAASTLDDLHRLDGGFNDHAELDPRTAAALVRNAIADVDQTIPSNLDHASVDSNGTYPAHVVRTIAAAIGEAVRNTVRHAGTASSRHVAVVFADDSILATISDDGPGFAANAIPAHRMGIAVSITGRMVGLDGGTADIRSAPGEGTVVTVGWIAP